MVRLTSWLKREMERRDSRGHCIFSIAAVGSIIRVRSGGSRRDADGNLPYVGRHGRRVPVGIQVAQSKCRDVIGGDLGGAAAQGPLYLVICAVAGVRNLLVAIGRRAARARGAARADQAARIEIGLNQQLRCVVSDPTKASPN